MLEQALELWVEPLVVSGAVDVVTLRHPLDVQDDERDGQWVMGENGLGDLFGRPDDRAPGAEAALEILGEALEQLDVLGLFGGELQESARAVVVRPDFGRAWSRTNGRMNSSTRPKMPR